MALMLSAIAADAGESIPLRVTASVPPPPCEYPQACAPAPAATTSKVTISDGQVRYIGSTPSVTREGEVLTVKF